MSILTFDTLDSTNSYFKRNGKYLDHFTVVQANHQEKGKGRLGRSWQDQGNSLLFSILLKEKIEPERVPLLSLLAGASVVLTLEHYGLTPLVKWPNDTLVSEKKISGILTEAVSEGENIFYIVGIGINLNQKGFEGELSQNIDFDSKTIWEYNENNFPKLYRQNSILKSDSCFREDLFFLIQDNEDLAGRYKHVLEERQRRDRKLRAEYKK